MKKITVIFLAVFMLGGLVFPLGINTAQAANPSLQAWYYRKNESQANYSLESIAINGSAGVAVGRDGVILQSKDKKTWNRITPFSQEAFSGVIYAKSKYFVVGQSGSIYYSSSGITWSRIFSGGTALNGIIYGNSTLVAFGKDGGAYSTNGTSWYKFKTPTTSLNYCGTFGNSRFIIGGEGGKIFISVDGKIWVETTEAKITENIYGLTYGKGIYLMAGNNQLIATSKDGRIWEKQNSPLIDAEFSGAIFCKDHFILWNLFDATGMEETVPKKKVVFYFSSLDGKIWKNNAFYVDFTYVKSPWINGITLASDGFLYGVGEGGIIEKSKDGLRWAFVNSTTTSFFFDILKNGSTYIAVGTEDNADGAIFTSKDGYRWGQEVNPEVPVDEKEIYVFPLKKTLYTVAFGKGVYVVGGEKGILMYSKNAVDWAVVKSPAMGSIFQIEFVKDRFIGITNEGYIIASYDGINWTEGAVQQKDFMCISMAYDEKGNILINGSQWYSGEGWSQTKIYRFNSSEINPIGGSKASWNNPQTVSDDSSKFMGKLCYGNGTFVMLGYNGHSFTSTDSGITWSTNFIALLFGGAADINYGHGHFLAVGPNQTIASSPDGITWKTEAMGGNMGMYAEEYTGVFLTPEFSYITTSNKRMLYATNGFENWMDMEANENYTINDVVYAGKFGFIGAADGGYVFVSKEGAAWFKLKVRDCDDIITHISYIGASEMILLGTSYGKVYTTKDLTNWTSYDVPGGLCVNTSTTNGKIVILVAGEGTESAVLTSDINCKNWTFNKINLGGTITGLAYANNYFVAVGINGNLQYSKDGKVWKKASVATTNTFTSVARCGDRFVAVGVNGTIAYSYNGYSKWTVLKTSFRDNLLDICYGGGMSLVTSDGGKIYMSQNKTSWTLIRPISFGTFYAGAVNSLNVFVIVGENGLIMQSLPIKYL